MMHRGALYLYLYLGGLVNQQPFHAVGVTLYQNN